MSLLIAVTTLVLLVWGFDRLILSYWVGSTDLEVEFAVTDAATADPLPGARVEVKSYGGFYSEDFKQEFTLAADAAGLARKECRHSMCFGTSSGLHFTNSIAVHLPFWSYRVVAEGYQPSEWAYLDVLEQRRQVQRAGPGRAMLVVPVSLHKMLAEQVAAPDRGGK
jgi:hypothetical protein